MVIAVVSAKGGTGKSTVTINLASVLAAERRDVLVVDADPQGSIARWDHFRRQDLPDVTVHPSPVPKKKAGKLGKKYSLTLFDAPPTLKRRMRSLFRVSDLLIIPVSPGLADLWSTEQLVKLYLAEKEHRPTLDARILINRVDRRTRLGREFRGMLSALNIPIFLTEIPQRTEFNDAWLAGMTVDRLHPSGRGARELRRLAGEVKLWITKSSLT